MSKALPRHQFLLTLDSLRWDVFEQANIPFLKNLGKWKKAFTQGTYTFPAHMSFFAGRLPQTADNTDYYDAVAFRTEGSGRLRRNRQLFRLDNPEASRSAGLTLSGRNVVQGFARLGYATIGSGAVNWFDPALPAGHFLTSDFEYYAFFHGPNHASHASARRQVDWARTAMDCAGRPCFVFLNFGETHHRFVYEDCPWEKAPFAYGDAEECHRRQRACLEYLDGQIRQLLEGMTDYDLVICGDHGEAFGEDGLWGHGFYHRTIMEVPLLIRASP